MENHSKKVSRKISILLTILLSITAFTACQKGDNESDNQAQGLDFSIMSEFASYQENPVDIIPSVEPYQVEKGLDNVINKDNFPFTDEAIELLEKNHFLVAGGQQIGEFFSTYEMNRYESMPNFITTDSMLHNYHLYFSHLLRTLEGDYLYDTLRSLTEFMLDRSVENYNDLRDSRFENAAKRNVAFFSVAGELLNLGLDIPDYVAKEVEGELAMIDQHSDSQAPSLVMNMGLKDLDSLEALREDYTQYIPRSHYTTSEELKAYFKGMIWYGRLTFRASIEDETMSAALIAMILDNEEIYELWHNIYEPTNFFVGKSDDLGYYQYSQLLKHVYGKMPDLKDLKEQEDTWKDFLQEASSLEAPAINSIPIFDEEIQEDREDGIKGFRFMGQRFTLDASIFQRLIYREVKENEAGEARMLPKGLDIPAAMGSETAYNMLKEMGETSYPGYEENMDMMREGIGKLDLETKTQNLYWSWLHMIEPLTEEKGHGYPMFMQNDEWTKKQLESYLSSWTELKHDTVLYAKQAYAEMGGGGEEEEDDRGYVEPNPEVYGRLASITRMTIEGLKVRNLLDKDVEETLKILETLALDLKTIAEKELTNKALTDEEYDLIRSYGGQLEHLWLEAMKDKGVTSISQTYENPSSLVTDVATDPHGQVLQEATGYINDIYVIVPVEGLLRIAKGAVFSYHEFPWPANDRLTDEKWQTMLRNGEAPEQPAWTESYTFHEGLNWW